MGKREQIIEVLGRVNDDNLDEVLDMVERYAGAAIQSCNPVYDDGMHIGYDIIYHETGALIRAFKFGVVHIYDNNTLTIESRPLGLVTDDSE